MKWETVIGLEVHVQLQTQSKIFSSAHTTYGAPVNSQACLVDLAMPGTLPVVNEQVINMAIKFGLAVNAEIAPQTIFARKNYFYPDLPKGYQISQLDHPIVSKGAITIVGNDGTERAINLTRAHLEEDAGKSLHEDFHGMSGIDLNRAGVPLLEVVSEPELRSAKEAVAYVKQLHSLVRYLEICDGNMQEGSLRCDANVSIRPAGTEKLGTRAEIKNVNSFRFLEKAINFEIERQQDILEDGGQVVQETRLYDSNKNETRSMRSKEEANDYRYFPDPDLLPVEISKEMITAVKATMPELAHEKQQRFQEEFKLSHDDAVLLCIDKSRADFFETALTLSKVEPKLVANFMIGELFAVLNKDNISISQSYVTAEQFAGLLQRIHDKTISNKIAKTVFAEMWSTQQDADAIIKEKGLQQVSDSGAIIKIIDEIINANPGQVEQYRAGKDKVLGFFVGQVMKAMQGKADPGKVNHLLKERLS